MQEHKGRKAKLVPGLDRLIEGLERTSGEIAAAGGVEIAARLQSVARAGRKLLLEQDPCETDCKSPKDRATEILCSLICPPA